jgi:hypothetical protein
MALFSVKELLGVQLRIEERDNTWGFSFVANLGSAVAFSDMVPAIKSLDTFAFADAMLVISTFKTGRPQTFAFTPRSITMAEPGVVLSAQLGLSGDGLDVVQEWTGLEAIELRGTFGTTTTSFRLEVSVVP